MRGEDSDGFGAARVRQAGRAGIGIAPASERPGASAGPKIPEALASVDLGSGDELEEFERVSVIGAALSGAQTQSILLTESRLSKVDLTDARLARMQATDVAFRQCNVSNAALPDPVWRRVLFAESKLSGVQVDGGTLTDVEFRGCRLDFAAFGAVKFKQVTFRECVLREAEFSNVSFDRVTFVGCDLTRASFGRMRIARSEMRRCTLTGLRHLAELRGIAMEWNDVLANVDLFASELGIAIASDPA
jgi:uncharacterized protein YjbI with pentapeptide repeats